MTIDIAYDQALFIRDQAAARLRNAMEVLNPAYQAQFLSARTPAELEDIDRARRAEIHMLRELLIEICRYCDYKRDGKDTDGTVYYRCTVHDNTEPSRDAPCAGYIEEPYQLKLSEEI